MSLRLAVVLACLLIAGCACFASVSWPPFSEPPAPPVATPPVKLSEPVPPSVRPVEAPRTAPTEIAKVENGDRAKRLTAARGDLKTGLTALTLRAVTACTEPGEACVENQALIDRARGLDARLAAALLDPQLAVNWAEVTTVLRGIVDGATRGAPK